MKLSQRKYADHRRQLGLSGGSRAAVQDAIKSGRIADALDEAGQIDTEIADRLWAERTHRAKRPLTGPAAAKVEPTAAPVGEGEDDAGHVEQSDADEPPDLDYSRRRKEHALAGLAERQLAQHEGRYVETAAVRRAVEKRYRIAQTHLLGLSSKLASRLSREDHLRVAPVVKQVVRQVLDEIADEEHNDA